MTDHLSTHRIHAALDGELSAVEQAQLQEHLEHCAECRETYARLSEVVGDMRSLPRSGRVPDAVWDAVSRRIEASSEPLGPATPMPDAGTVVAFPGGGSTGPPAWRASIPRLTAVTAMVAILSAGATWMVLVQVPTAAGPPAATSPDAGAPAVPLGARAVRAVASGGDDFARVVGELEMILAEGRGLLAPETLSTVEASLRTVDEAITDVETALQDDPNSPLLRRLLSEHRDTKLGVLRRAVAAVEPRT